MNNISFISHSRVVATIFIVICHVIKYYLFVPGHMLLGQFFNVGVPMFIIISGYLYGVKSQNWGGYNLGFFIKRILKVSLPVQVFSVILLILGLNTPKQTLIYLLNMQGIGFLVNVPKSFECGHYLSQTWFVTVILLCYISLPLIYKVSRQGKMNVPKIILIFGVSCLTPYIGIYVGLLFLFFLSYYVGHHELLKRYSFTMILSSLILAVSIRLVGRIFFDNTILYNDILSMISSFVLAVSIMLLIREISFKFPNVNRVCNSGIYKFIERYSYYIYITHYCLLPFTYHKFGVVSATLLFIVCVISLSIALKILHDVCEKSIVSLNIVK